jgi:hypothetical protein
MNDTLRPTRWFYLVTVSWGLGGGLSVVAAHALGNTPRTRALMIVLAYAALVIGSFVTVRRVGSYGRRFGLGLGAFMLATLVVDGYVLAVLNPVMLGASLWEHAWRLGFMAALGILATAIPLALGASIARFGGGQGASRGPLIDNPDHGRRDSDRPEDTALQADAAGIVSPVLLEG